jgi:Tol biopolymer transport system component
MSPDGRTVAFAVNSDKVSFRKAVFTVRMNGSHLTKIVPFRLDVSSKLDWSPNGERLLYTPYIDFPKGHVPNVFTIRPDGSRLHQLTNASGNTAAISGSYSPNGRWIVYRREAPNGYSQWKMHRKRNRQDTHSPLIDRSQKPGLGAEAELAAGIAVRVTQENSGIAGCSFAGRLSFATGLVLSSAGHLIAVGPPLAPGHNRNIVEWFLFFVVGGVLVGYLLRFLRVRRK